ncbi:hypothetical protein NW754_000370 [Fusarium falciforme]|uniref:Hypothetical protein n=1 Tax=Fusarium falciforme TaxID=195108 RepID=UPI00230083A9|nr:Hypothetical protein NCS54_00281700 [Fusarium falciforme]KAJ4137966.1 hypothetical protein NW754_000370 [Fusarium falciforme]KAJ4210438.1 hypothetical protein NW767_000711 [Fusarium falciforme]KAJ4253054.1 hypothetical protein NW757_005759 [Fusarium falciforme]WAO85572.1 Hypothetical protein NCS54_00281700 [Fusarium falciforme]
MVRSLALLAGAVAVIAAAETKTVKWWIPEDIETKGYKASVVSIDGEDTTLAVNKDSTTGIIASGPSTLTAAITIETDDAMNYQEYHCELDPDKDQASCTHQVSMSRNGNIIQDVSDTTVESYQETMAPIIVTAGAEKLGDEENTTAADESSAAEASATAAPKPKATEAEATSSGNAAPMMTQNAVFAGVAAVVGGAAVLL